MNAARPSALWLATLAAVVVVAVLFHQANAPTGGVADASRNRAQRQ